eukprot:TRINITY_DN9503_c0_g1_i1.p4 TRINITY_DN9503_c0_g1~~TRINITY_DN9503_c0_g1_i1.p4  ORF type:complete len:106 (-),score=16.19 TRINITY_DN9503_c0_g1_i1:298-615(-)
MEETARGRDEAYREQGAAGGDIEQPCARAAMHSNASSADGAAQPKHGFFTVEFIFYALLIAVRAPPATSCIWPPVSRCAHRLLRLLSSAAHPSKCGRDDRQCLLP